MDLQTACQVIRDLEPNKDSPAAHGLEQAAKRLGGASVARIGGVSHVSLELVLELLACASQIPAEIVPALIEQAAQRAGDPPPDHG